MVIQGSLMTFFIVSGVIPDLLLIMVVCLAFIWGDKRAIMIGIIAGFIQDVFWGPAIGFFCLAKMIAALLAGLASHEIYRDQIIGPMITVFFVTFVHEIIVFSLTGFFWGNTFSFYFALEKFFLPRAVYHFILTMFLYPLFYRAEQHNFFYPSFK
jgi:rod shape-determining protein MreD